MTATTAQQLPAFFVWLQTYGGYISFFVQTLWWILTAVAAVWAAWNFQRYVETRMGTMKAESGLGSSDVMAGDGAATSGSAAGSSASGKDAGKASSGEQSPKVDVDRFVD